MSTFINISTITVGAGGAASIDFTSIPATYTDLKLVYSVRGALASVNIDIYISFNGSTANFTTRYIQAYSTNKASATSPVRNIGVAPAANSTANTFGNSDIYIPNYAGSQYKSFQGDSVEEENNITAYLELLSNLWSDTSAINQVTIAPHSGNFAQYSSATLYGIKSS